MVAFPAYKKMDITGEGELCTIMKQDYHIETTSIPPRANNSKFIPVERDITYGSDNGSGCNKPITKPGHPEKSPQELLRRERRRAYNRYFHSQNRLRKQAIDVELLTEALRNLSALESMSLVDHLDHEDPPWGARR